MIRYYCDKCNKELKTNETYRLTIAQDKFVYSGYHLCEQCRFIVENICEEKNEEETDLKKELNIQTNDELFEEIGYEKSKENNEVIQYTSSGSVYNLINFKLDRKQVFVKEVDEDYEFSDGMTITMQELKAINQKCKEMGWLDEN